MHQFGTTFPTLLRFRQSRQLVEEFFYMGREFFRLRHVPARYLESEKDAVQYVEQPQQEKAG